MLRTFTRVESSNKLCLARSRSYAEELDLKNVEDNAEDNRRQVGLRNFDLGKRRSRACKTYRSEVANPRLEVSSWKL